VQRTKTSRGDVAPAAALAARAALLSLIICVLQTRLSVTVLRLLEEGSSLSGRALETNAWVSAMRLRKADGEREREREKARGDGREREREREREVRERNGRKERKERIGQQRKLARGAEFFQRPATADAPTRPRPARSRPGRAGEGEGDGEGEGGRRGRVGEFNVML